MLKDKAPEAEFAAVYVSINSEREVHIDRNNAMGTLNYLLPIAMPRRGGKIWQELRNGDTVHGRVVELKSQDGSTRYGCAYPLQEGTVFQLNPHRRHAVLPSTGQRLVIVGYTPGVLQNLKAQDRARLWELGFPMPLFEDDSGGSVRINMLSINSLTTVGGGNVFQKELEAMDVREPSEYVQPVPIRDPHSGGDEVQPVTTEEWVDWDMRLVLPGNGQGTVSIGSSISGEVWQRKAEVAYTENIEQLLRDLEAPISIVHTINPKEVAQNFTEWLPSLSKELRSLEHAVEKVSCNDDVVVEDIRSGRGQTIPMKVVYTIKPPDQSAEGQGQPAFFKRKSRIVVCGNMASHQPGEVYTNTAPAEVVRAAIAIARMYRWCLGMIDVVAAFLQTPLKELKGAPLVYGIPPKALIRAGLCQADELWRFTHAIYGLQESPKLWGAYRDIRLAKVQFENEGEKVILVQGKVEPSWWAVQKGGSELIGIIVVYVDDLLICGPQPVIRKVAEAIGSIWKTSELQLASEVGIRFLGMDIQQSSQGFMLSQKAYIEELVRLHQVPRNRRDLIPISKDQATFNVEEHEGEYSDWELKSAQQCAGELLWVSQRTRPDISYVASLVGSLATRAPRRAVQIAEKAIAFLQRTASYSLMYQGDSSELVAYCDASFAPDGAKSHSGWLVFLNDCVISWKSGRQSTITLSTAEAELTAMSEAVLAIQSINAMLSDMLPRGQRLQLYSDSTAALAIANGSGSWRTRHLRLRSAWVAELIENQDITIHHCIGEVQPADLLTKALASQRMKALSTLINLREAGDVEEEAGDSNSSNSTGSSRANAPNKVSKGLIALLVLSQAARAETFNWEEEEALVVRSSMSVDYGLLIMAADMGYSVGCGDSVTGSMGIIKVADVVGI